MFTKINLNHCFTFSFWHWISFECFRLPFWILLYYKLLVFFIFFPCFFKYARKNSPLHQTSPVVNVIVVLKWKFFDFKLTITTTIKNNNTNDLQVQIYTRTICNDYVSCALWSSLLIVILNSVGTKLNGLKRKLQSIPWIWGHSEINYSSTRFTF